MIGPAVLLAWVPAAAAAGLVVGAAALNAWLGFADWKTFAIAAGAGAMALGVAQSGSAWTRLALIALLGVTAYLMGHVQGASGRDQWWRGQLATSSVKIEKIVAKAGAEAITTDNDIIEAIRGTDAKLNEAERNLDAAKLAKVVDQCMLPAHCLEPPAGLW